MHSKVIRKMTCKHYYSLVSYLNLMNTETSYLEKSRVAVVVCHKSQSRQHRAQSVPEVVQHLFAYHDSPEQS